jgi:hypothetical protein
MFPKVCSAVGATGAVMDWAGAVGALCGHFHFVDFVLEERGASSDAIGNIVLMLRFEMAL